MIGDLLRKTAVLASGTAAAGLLGLAARALFARGMPPEVFGLAYAVLQSAALVGLFKSFGVNRALQQRIPVYAAADRDGAIVGATLAALVVSLATALASGGLAVLLADWLAENYLHAPGAERLVWWVAAYLLVVSGSNTLYAIFYAYRLPGPIGLRQVELRLVVLAGAVATYLATDGPPEAVIAANTAGEALTLATGLRALRRTPFPFGAHAEPIAHHAADLLGYGGRALFGSVVGKLLGRIEVAILTAMGALKGVALYEVSLVLARVVVSAGSLLNQMLFPSVADLKGRGRTAELPRHLRRLRLGLLACLVPVVAASWLLGRPILSLVFGAAYREAAPALAVLTAGSALHAVTLLHAGVLSGLDRPGRASLVTISIGVSNVALDVLLIPRAGYVGAAWATAGSYVVGLAVSSVLVRRALRA